MVRLIILASIFGVLSAGAFSIILYLFTRKYIRNPDKQLKQHLLMANISRIFLSDKDIDIMISNTLRMIGEFLNIPQVLLFWLEDKKNTLICRNEWINPKFGFSTRIGSKLPLQEPMLSIIKNLKPDEGEDSCLCSNDPVIKKAMSPYRVNFKNYITTPIFSKGEMCAVLDFSREDDGQKWSKSDISLATLFASTLSGVFERELMGRQTLIVENSPFMIFYSDSAGNLAYANPAAAAVSGYTLAELKAGGFSLILEEDDFIKVKEVYIPQAAERGIVKHETNFICRDGRRRLLEVTSFVLKDGIIAAICADLTEQNILETKLIEEKDKAEKASRAKGEFLSTMSHEMRTPMNAIIGMTAIGKNSADINRKNYALDKIEKASTHLLGIINDVLDMSKIEANKLELIDVDFDLRNILHKAVSLVYFKIEEKHQKFSMNVDSNIPNCFSGDDQRLTQIITNLLSNAAKFTPDKGEISVDVFFEEEHDGIIELRFEVADSGIGINEDQHEKIFHNFEQAESDTTRKYGGTGLGLPISRHIIELMGGIIYVKSQPGKGSRFIFTVKLKYLANNSGAVKSGEILTGKKDNMFKGKKILLAEDIEINREILITLLDGTGLSIDTAENGKEALDKYIASNDLYDLILMDLQMPEMDGLEATRRIRAQKTSDNSRIPIIAMTANVFKDDINKCLEAGMDDHIGKPIDINVVLEKLRNYL